MMATKKVDWSVRFELAGDPTEEQLDVLADRLDRNAGIVGGGYVGRTYGVRLSLKAPTSLEAVSGATLIMRKALADIGLDPETPIVEHEAQSMDLLIAQNRGASADALVGLSDVANMHGFSRQRALELSKIAGFPKPAATLSAGRVWHLVDVERFLAMPRKPGRPRKSSEATLKQHSNKSKVAATRKTTSKAKIASNRRNARSKNHG
jgi:hypothetical protein